MSTTRLFSAALAVTLTAAALPWVHAQNKPAQLVPTGSEISFTTRQMGVPVEGKFGKFSANISLDPKAPQTGSVGFSIDTGSARFGSAELDAEVPKATWLNVAKFPQASFQSNAIKATGPGKFEVTGKLNIKGSVRDVVVPVQLTQTAGNSTATGSFTIKRLEFKVGEAEWTDTSLLANDVNIKFKLQLAGLAPL
ncbi:MAG: YceI family protein [Burkholderiaceae bacterium]